MVSIMVTTIENEVGETSFTFRLGLVWLFCLIVYQPFSVHLTPNQVILMKVCLFQGLHIFKYLFMVFNNFQIVICFYIFLYCLYIG